MVVIFTMICIIGFSFLFLSFIFGHHGDIDHDVSIDGHDGDFGTDHGGVDGHGSSHGHMKWLNINVISMFITAFSGTGAITKTYNLNDFLVYSISFSVAALAAALAALIVGVFQKQQISSHITTKDFSGQKATVVLTIPTQGLGEIKLLGGDVYRSAKSQDGEEIKQGEEVEILSSGSPVMVRKIDRGGK